MDFNESTGMVSPALHIGSTVHAFNYGVEFSPNGEVLYVRGWGNALTQYDLSLSTAAAISASEYVIPTPSAGSGGGVQMGPDLKVYTSISGSPVMSVINDPDVLGVGCNFQDTAVVMTGNGRWGLPTFVQSFFNTSFSCSNLCVGDSNSEYYWWCTSLW